MSDISVPDIPGPTAKLCWQQGPLMARCDRALDHTGPHTWEMAAENAILRAALVGFVGSDDPTELDAIEVVIRGSAAPASDMAVAINGLDALRQTRRAALEALEARRGLA